MTPQSREAAEKLRLAIDWLQWGKEFDEDRARWALESIAELKARKCSHGDYRMVGTTDCRNWDKCDGRTEFYVIGDGLCVSCRHAAPSEADGGGV